MPENNITAAQEPVPADMPASGSIQVSVVSSVGMIPVENATVTISFTGDPESPLQVLTTDNSGQTPTVQLPAPPLELSLDPEATQQPYSEYNIYVTAEGYEPVYVSGSEIFADEFSLQPIRMNPLATTEEEEKRVFIPVHTLFGDYPPKIPEDEIKPMDETGEIVLSRVVIPEYIIVHDGVPSDPSAPNYWVRYRDYIKNVASCEIYSTWPESAIYANILVIQSFTLNRVYTEWYRNQRLRPEVGIREEHFPEYRLSGGHHLCQLPLPSRRAPAHLYVLLRRTAGDLCRFKPVGLQVSGGSGVLGN